MQHDAHDAHDDNVDYDDNVVGGVDDENNNTSY